MKRHHLAGSLLLCSSLLLAAEDADTKRTELKETMRHFASALELIQHGILYNNPDDMHKGAQLLDRNERGFIERHGEAIEMDLPDNPKFARSYAILSAGKIRDQIDRLIGSLGGPHDYRVIATSYTQILNECVGCHQKIRQW